MYRCFIPHERDKGKGTGGKGLQTAVFKICGICVPIGDKGRRVFQLSTFKQLITERSPIIIFF
jgi:hypothetical protein